MTPPPPSRPAPSGAATMADLINQHRATEAKYDEVRAEYLRSLELLTDALEVTRGLVHDGQYWDTDGWAVYAQAIPTSPDLLPLRKACDVEAPLDPVAPGRPPEGV